MGSNKKVEVKSNVLSIVPQLEQKKVVDFGYSPKQALEEALADLGNTESEESSAFTSPTKMLILALDDSDENYTIGYIQAGMKMTECIALVEVAKQRFLQNMGI